MDDLQQRLTEVSERLHRLMVLSDSVSLRAMLDRANAAALEARETAHHFSDTLTASELLPAVENLLDVVESVLSEVEN